MILDVPVRGVDRLPDPVQVRFAVRRPQRIGTLRLTHACAAEPERGDHNRASTSNECAFQQRLHLGFPLQAHDPAFEQYSRPGLGSHPFRSGSLDLGPSAIGGGFAHSHSMSYSNRIWVYGPVGLLVLAVVLYSV